MIIVLSGLVSNVGATLVAAGDGLGQRTHSRDTRDSTGISKSAKDEASNSEDLGMFPIPPPLPLER